MSALNERTYRWLTSIHTNRCCWATWTTRRQLSFVCRNGGKRTRTVVNVRSCSCTLSMLRFYFHSMCREAPRNEECKFDQSGSSLILKFAFAVTWSDTSALTQRTSRCRAIWQLRHVIWVILKDDSLSIRNDATTYSKLKLHARIFIVPAGLLTLFIYQRFKTRTNDFTTSVIGLSSLSRNLCWF